VSDTSPIREAARRLFGDDFDPTATLSVEDFNALIREECAVEAERAAAAAETAPPEPSVPSDAPENVQAALARAAELDRKAEERARLVKAARTLVAHDQPELGDINDLTDDEILGLSGLVETEAARDARLANDYAANVEASLREPEQAGMDWQRAQDKKDAEQAAEQAKYSGGGEQ
jgi:hypothetical protein